MSDDNENDSGDDWDEVNEESQDITCLFCIERFDNFTTAIKHLETVHKFRLMAFKRKYSLDVYSYIKLVNFIRASKLKPEELDLLNPTAWESDKYLAPILQDDSWLMFGKDKLIPCFLNIQIYTIYSFLILNYSRYRRFQ